MCKWRGQEVRLVVRKKRILFCYLLVSIFFNSLFLVSNVEAQAPFADFVRKASQNSGFAVWMALPVDEIPDLYQGERFVQECRELLTELHQYDQSSLTSDQQVAYATMEFF